MTTALAAKKPAASKPVARDADSPRLPARKRPAPPERPANRQKAAPVVERPRRSLRPAPPPADVVPTLARPTQARVAELAKAALKRWRDDPVAFSWEVLGVRLWRGQRDIVLGAASHSRTAVRSGHKCGKSTALACLALWWVCVKRRARVLLTAPSHRQVAGILWKEITRLYNGAKIKLGGLMHASPEAGLQFRDGREIIGFATDDTERMAGFSGPACLFLIDEASGVPAHIFAAINGNRMGGAKLVMTGNPTQTSGVFYDAFHSQKRGFHGIHLSSWECAREAPGELGDDYLDAGLAHVSMCQEYLEAAGGNEQDPEYAVRVLGNFPSQSSNAAVPTGYIDVAKRRTAPKIGQLNVGVDVARFGNDCSAITARRTDWVAPPLKIKGFDSVEVAGAVLQVVNDLRQPNEIVLVKVDTTNNGGVADILRRHTHLVVIDVVASNSPTKPGFSQLRDQLWWDARERIRVSLALPDDKELHDDLSAPLYEYDEKGRKKVESKKRMRKRIGRSPDLADSLILAIYEPGTQAVTELVLAAQANDDNSDDDDD